MPGAFSLGVKPLLRNLTTHRFVLSLRMSYISTPPYFFVACTGATLPLTGNWFVNIRISLTCWFAKKRDYTLDTVLVILNLSIRWELKRYTIVMSCSTLDEIHPRQQNSFNPLNAELNPICRMLALLEAHHILHVGRIKVKATQPLSVLQKYGQ